MKRFWKKSRKLGKFTLALFLATGFGSLGLAWNEEKQLARFNPGDPRPDILPRTLYNAWVPYRQRYNRPHPIGGHISAVIEPTSQEAMAWHIAKANGDYRNHRPGYIPLYYYPKPWEALPTEPRVGTPSLATDALENWEGIDLEVE